MQEYTSHPGATIPHTHSRFAAFAAAATGIAIVAASTTAVIKTGNQDLAHAALTSTMAAGVIVGAVVISRAWQQRRRSNAVIIAVALIAAELFGLVLSGERIVAEREVVQATTARLQGARRYAEAELERANRALEAANGAAVTEAAKPGCKANCRALLEGQVTLAQQGLARARELVAANPAVTASGTPLADRLGWQPWALDLMIAALLAIGANGLGAALVAFGCHAPAAGGQLKAQEENLDLAERLRRFEASGVKLAADEQGPGLDPTPPRGGPRRRTRQTYVANRARVLAFHTEFKARQGRDPSAREIEAATGVAKTSAHRYLARAA